MKGKTTVYILLVCVAVVWGIIGFRIFAAVAEEDQPILIREESKGSYFNEKDHSTDTVALDLDYRDPFSTSYANVVVESPAAIKPNMKINQPLASQKPQVNWSGIAYKGHISNPASKQRIAIMQINGTEVMLAVGQHANGLKLIKNLGDSVLVQYQNTTKYIKLN